MVSYRTYPMRVDHHDATALIIQIVQAETWFASANAQPVKCLRCQTNVYRPYATATATRIVLQRIQSAHVSVLRAKGLNYQMAANLLAAIVAQTHNAHRTMLSAPDSA